MRSFFYMHKKEKNSKRKRKERRKKIEFYDLTFLLRDRFALIPDNSPP